jgi:hypothetical protein
MYHCKVVFAYAYINYYHTVNPCPTLGICSLKAVHFVDPWMNLVLCGINDDMGTQRQEEFLGPCIE